MPDSRRAPAAMHRALSSRPVRVGFVLLAVALATWAVASEWPRVRSALGELSPLAAAAALLAATGALLAGLAAWRSLIAGLGSPLPWRAAGRVLFVGQLGKYLPGAVWPMVAQMELGRDQGVPRSRSATAFVLLTLFNLASGLAVACLTLPFAVDGLPTGMRWLLLLAPVAVASCHPRLLNPVVGRLLHMTGRPPLEHPITGRTCATVLAVLLVQWALFGLHVLALGADLGGDLEQLWLASVGGFALAWSLGPLLVVAPAGLGVREVTLVGVLAPALGAPAAIVLALASRVLVSATDLGLAIAFAAAGRNPPRQ